MVRLGVVTHSVTVGNERPETHHAVGVRRHLEGHGEAEDGTVEIIFTLCMHVVVI